ncbi:MAG: hypothetical protein V4651_11655 [Bacteroidota bacterium]
MTLSYYIKGHILNIIKMIGNKIPDPLKSRNIIFKNKHKGQRCFILGSGHSILTQDLTKLNGEIVFTQNHFHAHKDIAIIRPTYHVVVPMFQPPEYDKDWVKWLEGMEEKLPDDTIFFMGANTKKIVDEHSHIADRTYYMDHGLDPVLMNKAVIDITQRIMNVQTVITQCITIALYMGFDKIYLLGFDLDQIVHLAQNRDNVRFYGNSPVTDNNAERGFEEVLGSSGEDYYNQWMIWKQLNLLKRHAESKGIEIINLTNGGLLNVFKRQSYESIIN